LERLLAVVELSHGSCYNRNCFFVPLHLIEKA
jgi:hypothetical protein